MYQENPFRTAKQMHDNMSEEDRMKLSLEKKRQYHQKLVDSGQMTQEEFDRLEQMGEFGTQQQ